MDEGSPVVAKEAETKELPPPEVVQPPEEPMTTEELEITTADTQPLSPEVKERLEHAENLKAMGAPSEETMETPYSIESTAEPKDSFGDVLLDLEHCQPVAFTSSDDVILDIDFDASPVSYSAPVVAEVEAQAFAHSFAAPVAAESYIPEVQPQSVEPAAPVAEPEYFDSANYAPEAAAHFVDSDVVAGVAQADESPAASATSEPESSAGSGQSMVNLDQLSPAVIDAIARRVVEHMSERAVQEIAWEVVPQLADLMIKRKLEEHETQNR